MALSGRRHYPNAPITEAIIDLRVELPKQVTVANLDTIHAREEAAYPDKKNRNLVVGQMHVGGEVAAAASSKHIGYLFTGADKKQVFQVRLDGFTMRRHDWLETHPEYEACVDAALRFLAAGQGDECGQCQQT
ncbi:MAG: TIGR04255 family protein [Phycisphaerae bacterium]